MTRKKDSANRGRRSKWLRQWLEQDGDRLKELVKAALEEVLEAEMEETLQAAKGERTPRRLGYRAGYSSRSLVTRVGKIELRVPQDREGRFRTELFERYQRSEKAWVAALVEMYVAGVSTRKVKGITEELCGHEFSSGTISRLVGRLDEELGRFAGRRLEEEYPYLVLDARYERVREDGAVRSQAVLVAVGVNWEGRRSVLGVELAEREPATAWREFLVGLRERGLRGVVLVVSDDHAGLRRAIQEVLPEALSSAGTCTSCATRWTACRARRTMTVWWSCAGFMSGVTWGGAAGLGGVAREVVAAVREVMCVGRGEHRGRR